MKQTLPVLCLAISLLTMNACKKNVSPDKAIIGNWELRFQYGGYTTPSFNPSFPPGNGYRWTFHDNHYSRYENSMPPQSGTYTIGEGISPATGSSMNKLILDGNDSLGLPIFFTIQKDTLTMYQGIIAADGVIRKYVKVNYEY